MGRRVRITWVGGQYTMDRGVKIPWFNIQWIGVKIPWNRVKIPWVGGQNTMDSGKNTMGRGFNIP